MVCCASVTFNCMCKHHICTYVIFEQKRKKNSYLTSGTPAPPRRSLRIEAPPVASTENTETLRIPGLPASLTIERIKTQVCLVCRKPGGLGVCSSCTAEYHTACAAQCPQCSLKTEPEQLKGEPGALQSLTRDFALHCRFYFILEDCVSCNFLAEHVPLYDYFLIYLFIVSLNL